MRLLLIQPDYARKRENGGPPAGLMPARSLVQLALLLEGMGHETRVLDPFSAASAAKGEEEVDVGAAALAASREKGFDAAGVAVYTATRKEARLAAGLLKKGSRTMPVMAGGPHVSRLPKSLMGGWPEIDYALLGAAEESLPALVEALDKGSSAFRINNLAFRAGPKTVRVNGKASYKADLSALPPTRYDKYLEALPEPRIPRAYVMTARGCSFWCNFCSSLWKKVILAEPKRVADEIEHLARDCGTERVIIYDDCFGMNADHAASVLDALIEKKVEVELEAVTRFDVVTDVWLDKFVQAGGVHLFAGIETGSKKLRRRMNKHMADGDLCAGAEAIRKRGIKLGVYLMFGFPYEEDRDVSETVRLVRKLDPEQVMSSVFDVKPGDMLSEFSMSAEVIEPDDWLSEERRLINEMDEETLLMNAARATAFDRAFTKSRIMPEHDSADFIVGASREIIEPLIERETKRWLGNAGK